MSLIILIFTTILFLSSPSISVDDQCNKDDKKVLEALKTDLFLTGWPPLDQVPCCQLDGIECDPKTLRVIGIDIRQSFHNITIPPVITNLRFLRNIRFHKNPGLTGPIPAFIGTIKTLAFIDFSWNSFTGPVPTFLAKLKSLQLLDLSFNRLTGSIPPSLGLIPAITGISLDRNQLTGTIPDTLSSSKITYLILSHNNLTGSIPQSFANNAFQTLDLSRNQLSGDALHIFGKSKPLQYLDLSRNHEIAFDMSKVEFPSNMYLMYVQHNKIYGSLPPDITSIKWQFLNVSYNRLCGSIPTGNWSLRFDEDSFFHNRCLCGEPLPACK